MSEPFISCTIKKLPAYLLIPAAKQAICINPANAVAAEMLAHLLPGVMQPQHLALLTSKWWGTGGVKLGVYFMDTQDASLKARILSHMNAWAQSANVSFSEASAALSQVRLARVPGQGYYSYLGTDILHIPSNEPTLNLDSFSMQTPESEYKRVVRHETGHTLGFIHEHLRRALVQLLDRDKTEAFFERTQHWSLQEVDAQVLTPEDEANLTATPEADAVSIMCYDISGECTISGQPIPGGTDINVRDYALAAKLYPKSVTPPGPPPPPAPPPTGLPLFTKTFVRSVGKNGQVWFNAPVPILAGSTLEVFAPGTLGERLDGLSPLD